MDDGSLSGKAWAYFFSLRSGELAWKRDNHLHMEAYNPQRFARQFSCFQGLVSLPTRAKIIRKATTLKRIQEAYLCFVRSGTGSRVVISDEMAEQDNLQFDYCYAKWWYNSLFSVIRYNEDGVNSNVIFYDG